ncbi:MAG TPA: hypothetical protein VNH18_09750 [Bryobacteraceae bacterium]|nr:hypothetical protein [Bryobacteraceae bacterium]
MTASSRISTLLVAMVAIAGAYRYREPVRSAADRLLAASKEEFAKVPQRFRSLPEEIRAAAGQVQKMTVKATANVAVGFHELEDRL